jgi:hypothetical protein
MHFRNAADNSYFVLRNAKQADILQSAVERISEALSDKGYRAGYPFVAKRAPEDQWQPRR